MRYGQPAMSHRPPAPASGLNRFAMLSLAALLAACGSTVHRAPVEDRVAAPRPSPATSAPTPEPAATATATPVAVPTPDSAPKPLPGAENAGKPGYYSVKPGDTLIRVGLESGQNWRDIARWNGIDNPNVIEVGQVLRVVPPAADANGVVVKPVPPATRVDARPPGASAATPA